MRSENIILGPFRHRKNQKKIFGIIFNTGKIRKNSLKLFSFTEKAF